MENWWIDFKEFIYGIWVDFTQFMKDIVLEIFELFLDGIAYMIEQLTLPDFILGGLQAAVGAFPPTVLFLMAQTGVGAGLALLGAAFAFRLVRKIATLFQW